MNTQDSTLNGIAKPNRFGWFAAGGLTVAILMSGFLYTTGYFGTGAGLQADAGDSRNIIESKK